CYVGVLLGVTFSSACSSSQDRSASSARRSSTTSRAIHQSLRHVSLPNLSSAGESARNQINDRYALLMTKGDNPDASGLDLATAYGELGKILTAAEYFEAAEPCFLHAPDLQPTEIRWPYYLGHLHRYRNSPDKAAPFFEQSLRLQPDDVPALVWLGEMYLAQNKPDAAEPAFTRALSLQSQSAAAQAGLRRGALAKPEDS